MILTRLREVTMGEHRSRSRGSGFDFTGLRGWQAGDRLASIDWAQSSLTGFSPLIIREFEQPSTATVIAIADLSPSTRCGVQGVPIAAAIARAIATIGMSSVFFQDPFGLVTFDGGFLHLAALRPLTGKSHVVHCLDAYQYQRGLQSVRRSGSISTSLGSRASRPDGLRLRTSKPAARARSRVARTRILPAARDAGSKTSAGRRKTWPSTW